MFVADGPAYWVTSFPFAEYVKHAWAGAWVCSAFRREGGNVPASEMIRQAVAATRAHFGDPPPLGMITFIDKKRVPPLHTRKGDVWGYTYRKAGFREVGHTKGGLLALQLLPADMPPPNPCRPKRGPMLPEVRRILSLPRLAAEARLPPAHAEDLLVPGTPHALRQVQLAALGEAQRSDGLLGVIGVGQGKFLISVLAPSAMSNVRRPLLLVPPALLAPTRVEIERWRHHFNIHPNLLVMSYNDLSHAKKQVMLAAHAPDLIVADEVHCLKDRDAARTRRFVKWFQTNPSTRLVALSGTMSNRSLLDYDHIAELALRERSPLPREWVEVMAWAACIDARPKDPPTPHQRAVVEHLVKAFPTPENTPRASYYARLRSAPGVICTVDTSAAECSIILQTRRLDKPEPLVEAMKTLRTKWELPDGTELLRAADHAAAMRQLQVGFYYVWDWGPDGPNHEWLEARAGWARVVRNTLLRRIPEVDSPLQVEQRVRAGRANSADTAALAEWDRMSDTKPPPVKATWVSYEFVDALLDEVDRLEKERGPVLVWCESIALLDALEEMGLDVLRPGGQVPTKPRTLALSRSSFGTGRNLQAWNTNLVPEPTSSGTVWEQMIGRTHREGQDADDVLVCVPFWDGIALAYLTAARDDADYVQQSTGQRQKLSLASFYSQSSET